MTYSQRKRKLFALWHKEFGEDDTNVLVPMVPLDLKPHAILFVGLNPSFREKTMQRLLKEVGVTGDAKTCFLWSERHQLTDEMCQRLESHAKNNYQYFNKFQRVSYEVGEPWDHIDLFALRETGQERVKERVLKTPKGDPRLNDFGKSQMEIACAMIEDAQPKAIVVENALASRVYRNECELVFIRRRGYYVNPKHQMETPVFLSAMLTGRRALDVFSFERLVWHLATTLGKPLSGHTPIADTEAP